MIDAIAFILQPAGKFVSTLLTRGIRPAIIALLDTVTPVVQAPIETIAFAVHAPVNPITPAIQPGIDTVAAPVEVLLDAIASAVQPPIDAISAQIIPILNTVSPPFKDLFALPVTNLFLFIQLQVRFLGPTDGGITKSGYQYG
jgi:hypothetical protein